MTFCSKYFREKFGSAKPLVESTVQWSAYAHLTETQLR